jgi:hypothetical protein
VEPQFIAQLSLCTPRSTDYSPCYGRDTMQNVRSERWPHSWPGRNRRSAKPRRQGTELHKLRHRSLSERSVSLKTLQGGRVVQQVQPRLLLPRVLPAPDHPPFRSRQDWPQERSQSVPDTLNAFQKCKVGPQRVWTQIRCQPRVIRSNKVWKTRASPSRPFLPFEKRGA